MLFDAEQRVDDWFKDVVFDVCICGAGPAGITLARKLTAKGWSVALFESGGLEVRPESQELYAGKNVGLDYYPLDVARLRGLGGTSGHWAGYTRPLEAHDFDPRPYHPMSGWPIRKEDLDPFAGEAAEILDLASWGTPADAFGGTSDSLTPAIFRLSSPPTRFGTKYRDELTTSKLPVYLNATLVDIELDSSLRSVRTLTFRSYEREGAFKVRAHYAVLCLGGIENPRFLLNASGQMSAGIGNEHDLVGRYFCEHPEFQIGNAVFRSRPSEPVYYYAPSRELLLEKECLNFILVLHPWQRSRANRWVREAACLTPFSQRFASTLIGRDVICEDEITIGSQIEQSLNPDSRVMLSNEIDRFGQRRVALDWRLSELDYHTMRIAVMELGRRMANTDVGRAQIIDWLREASPKPPGPSTTEDVAAFHHMCTTRMSDDPRTGVVNRDCRVHDIDNLYIGGSSVFATCGYANPTYTITQLTLRLAGHLDSRLRSSKRV